jgi:hypothetical protein
MSELLAELARDVAAAVRDAPNAPSGASSGIGAPEGR